MTTKVAPPKVVAAKPKIKVAAKTAPTPNTLKLPPKVTKSVAVPAKTAKAAKPSKPDTQAFKTGIGVFINALANAGVELAYIEWDNQDNVETGLPVTLGSLTLASGQQLDLTFLTDVAPPDDDKGKDYDTTKVTYLIDVVNGADPDNAKELYAGTVRSKAVEAIVTFAETKAKSAPPKAKAKKGLTAKAALEAFDSPEVKEAAKKRETRLDAEAKALDMIERQYKAEDAAAKKAAAKKTVAKKPAVRKVTTAKK